MDEMDEIVKEFLIESAENLDKLDQDFVALERNPEDKKLLSSIFRVVHTIKGTCGFLGFQKLELVAHAGENILGKLRDGQLGDGRAPHQCFAGPGGRGAQDAGRN
jgi:two-component system, chemotaxis family, sensor kinase CheA